MKKTILAIILSISFVVLPIRETSALMIDVSQVASKVAAYIQGIQEKVNKVTQQVNQLKQIIAQGKNLASLANIANMYTQMTSFAKSSKESGLVKGTQKKVEEKNKRDNEAKKKIEEKTFEAKEKSLEIESKKMDEQIKHFDKEIMDLGGKCLELEMKYQELDVEDENKANAYDEWKGCIIILETLENTKRDAEKIKKDKEEEKIKVQNEKNEVLKKQDEEAKKEQKFLQENKSEESLSENINGDSSGEWDDENTKMPTIDDNDYTKMMNDYFYDPTDVKASEDGLLESQNKINRVIRNRKLLLVNASSHLMQLTSSMRYEAALSKDNLAKIFSKSAQSSDEIASITMYSVTKIENIKALLLYAKIQAAKLQYLAAKDLINMEIRKSLNGKKFSFSAFDLEKYILKEEDIKNESVSAISNDMPTIEEIKDYKF